MSAVQFKVVGCSFRSDGSGRLYGYKIPAEWEPSIGQMLKVPAKEGGWKSVKIMELDQAENPNINYVFGLELIEPEPESEDSTNDGGALIGKALAADLAIDTPQHVAEAIEKQTTPDPELGF